ncbi:hypothetical protein K1T71_012651 [Dendrolimus kikuchii]|uniref:Uncharacterized protein n=1 Tax=Dendrolimus kikuchii TaxID=765133 RepID=A0ACC1CJX3_9NEOP|nr:hypothetical protein K1T71_012651 [Dendrolimus kikuchii]
MKSQAHHSISNVHSHLSRIPQSRVLPLPPLQLPTFDGQPTEWNSFYDLFKSLITNNEHLSEVEKFRYLLLSVKGEPYNLIKSLPVTNENYNNTVQILINRYENTRIVASKHLDRSIDLENLNDKNIHDLRNLINIYFENITALKPLGFPIHSWDFVLLNILLRKLPDSVRTRFETSLPSPSEIPSVGELLDFLEKELMTFEVMSSAGRTMPHQVKPATIPQPQVRERRRIPLSRSLTNARPEVAPRFASSTPRSYNVHAAIAIDFESNDPSSASPSHFKNINKCFYCKSTFHPLYRCEDSNQLPLLDRKKIVANNKICINCLSVGHDVKNCNSKFSC